MATDQAPDRMRQRRATLIADLNQLEAIKYVGWSSEQRAHVQAMNAELTQIDLALIQSDNTEALGRGAAARESQRKATDDAAFWFRRFMLSLQVGNGAGLLAALSAVLQSGPTGGAGRMAALPAVFFGFGVLLAGVLPGLLWVERIPWVVARPLARQFSRQAVGLATAGSAILFTFAIIDICEALSRMGGPAAKFMRLFQ